MAQRRICLFSSLHRLWLSYCSFFLWLLPLRKLKCHKFLLKNQEEERAKNLCPAETLKDTNKLFSVTLCR